MTQLPAAAQQEIVDYLRQVEEACLDLPADQRGRLIAQLGEHLPEIEVGPRGLEAQLGPPAQYARDLRAAMDLPPPRTVEQSPRQQSRRHWIGAAGAVVAIAAIVVTVLVVANGRGPGPRAGRSGSPSVLDRLPRQTEPIQLGSGPIAHRRWTLWVQINPNNRPGTGQTEPAGVPGSLSLNHGLCTAFALSVPVSTGPGLIGGIGPCLTPQNVKTIAVAAMGPGSGFRARLLIGIIPKAATEVRIEFAGDTPLLVHTLTTDRLPGVSFFVADVTNRHPNSLAALDQHGRIIALAEPSALPR